jgi:hypothetical protein
MGLTSSVTATMSSPKLVVMIFRCMVFSMERRFEKTLLNYGSKIRSSKSNLFESFAFDHSDLFRVSGFEFRVYSDLALIFSATSR